MSRELVRAIGGEATGASRPEGGALFRFTLPLAGTADLDAPGEVDMAGAGEVRARRRSHVWTGTRNRSNRTSYASSAAGSGAWAPRATWYRPRR